MRKPINHHKTEPDIVLVDKIKAKALIDADKLNKLSAHKIWVPPKEEYPPHQHPSPHVIITLSGDGYVKCGNRGAEITHFIKDGDTFYVPENTRHQVGAGSRGLVMIAVSVDSKPLTDPERLQKLD